jgi:hypothetical protein
VWQPVRERAVDIVGVGLEMGREGKGREVDEAVRWRVMGSMGLGLLALALGCAWAGDAEMGSWRWDDGQ